MSYFELISASQKLIDILLEELATKGHHGMGLHVRPRTGRGKRRGTGRRSGRAAGTSAGGSSVSQNPIQEKPVQANPIQAKPVQEKPVQEKPVQSNIAPKTSDTKLGQYVSFSSGSEYVAHFQQMLQNKKIGNMSLGEALTLIKTKQEQINAQVANVGKEDTRELERNLRLFKEKVDGTYQERLQNQIQNYWTEIDSLEGGGKLNESQRRRLYQDIAYAEEQIDKANAIRALPKDEQDKRLAKLQDKLSAMSSGTIDIEQAKKDISSLSLQIDAAKKEILTDIHNSLIEPSRKTITTPVLVEDLKREAEIHNNTQKTPWSGKKPGARLEQFAQDHDVDLLQSHIKEGFEFVEGLIPSHVADAIKDKKGVAFTFDEKRTTLPVKIFDPETHKMLAKYEFASSIIDANPKNAREAEFKMWIGDQSDKSLPTGVKTYKDFQNWASKTVESAPEFSTEKLQFQINLDDRRSGYYPPIVSPRALTIDGKYVTFLGSNEKDGGIPLNGISLAIGAEMGRFSSAYDKKVSSNFDADQMRVLLKQELQRRAVHEYSHYIEMVSPEISGMMQDFLDRRTKGAAIRKLADAYPNRGFNQDEYFKDGGFIDGYIGRLNGRSSTEVFSMGMENLFKDPVNFLQQDPDHFGVIVAALKGIKP